MSSIPVLERSQYSFTRSLFQDLDFHLAVPAILNGDAPGKVYLDDPLNPRAGVIVYQHRIYIAGSPEMSAFNRAVNGLLLEIFQPGDEDVYFVVYPGSGWGQAIETEVLKNCQPKEYDREYYRLEGALPGDDLPVPAGFDLLPVDPALLDRRELEGLPALLEELCSERDTVQAFLEKSFGTVMVHGSELVSWCLSEYNTDVRCEVGIATAEKYWRRGLATITGRAFAYQAFENGIRMIGWHCWKDNTASGAAARKIGLQLVKTYPSYVGFLERDKIQP